VTLDEGGGSIYEYRWLIGTSVNLIGEKREPGHAISLFLFVDELSLFASKTTCIMERIELVELT
jgi:hypothetical protein